VIGHNKTSCSLNRVEIEDCVALALLAAKDTIAWMKEEGHFE
jgi:hypothetical protein